MSALEEKKELEALLHAHDTGQAPIKPHWVRNTTEADFQAGQASWLEMWRNDADFRESTWSFLRDGLVLAEVERSALLSVLYANYLPRLAASEFVRLEILKEWRDGKQLTSPCCAIMRKRRKIEVFAGNHRLNTALRIGATHVPLLIPKAQLPQFHKLLGDFPNHDQNLIKFTNPIEWWEKAALPKTDN
jgi:hypothetical protein